MNDNRLDQLFKKLERNETAPPDYIWQQICRKLEKRKRNKVMWFRSTSVAAVVILWIAFTMFSGPGESEVVRIYLSQPLRVEATDRVDAYLAEIRTPELQIPSFSPQCFRDNTPEKEGPIAFLASSIKYTNITPLYYASTKTPYIRTDFIPLTSQQNYKINQLYKELLARENSSDEKVKKEWNFMLSGQLSPGYSSGENKKQRSSADNSRGIAHLGGGIKIAASAGGRLKLQSGIVYSRFGQKNDKSTIDAFRFLTASAEGENWVSTPLGNIRSKSKAVVLETDRLAAQNSGMQSGSIEQLFDAVEIPLEIRYRLNKGDKIAWNIQGGINGSFVVSNRAYLNYGGNREYMGKTEDIRSVNWSAGVALGVEVPVRPKIKVLIEPGFRYYLQSVSSDREIDFKPYLFSFSAGIGIDF